MHCKFCGQKAVENSIYCRLCKKKIMEEGRTSNEEQSVKMVNGVMYVNPTPKNAWESWYYNEFLGK